MRGLFHIYTGTGKGKTTAALGLALRAYGQGKRILYCQFLKSGDSGEHEALNLLNERLTVVHSKPVKGFLAKMLQEEQEEVQLEQRKLFEKVVFQAASGEYDLVILDEAIPALNEGILSQEQVGAFIKERPENVELVFTGRGAPAELIELADYVSEIVKIKHPYDQGVPMRKGIEY
jgi:cob(I)alamin adenosyltransferase